jgi:molybdate-binding protein/transcriptional regulator with XRE-family HTH domain
LRFEHGTPNIISAVAENRRRLAYNGGIMSELPEIVNRVKACRIARGWSQDELARRSGISRAGVSAIEVQRLVPSTAAALALAAALDRRVEELFLLQEPVNEEEGWAWPPTVDPCRFWRARVGRRDLRFPVEVSPLGMIPHDGFAEGRHLKQQGAQRAIETLVLACCDPAAGLLARSLESASGYRLLVVPRSSGQALELLQRRVIHVAGLHLARADVPQGNADAIREHLGPGYHLLRLARWQEGVAVAPGAGVRSLSEALGARLRWIGREPGSGARDCLDELRAGQPSPRKIAYNHRSVADAIRSGWADAGVCLRLAGEEAGLSFFSVREEAYDLAYPIEWADDPRIRALVEVVRSGEYQRLVGELPGYDTSAAGELQPVD